MSGDSLHYDLLEMQLTTAGPVLDEVMIADARNGLSPAQMVERKLVSLLKATPLPMSGLHMASAFRAR
jgi:hypothetical protein